MKKILKSTIFMSVFMGIFFVVYRQSDKKRFDRLVISLKRAALIAAISAGLITNPVKVIEPDVTNNSTSIKRALFNQELDSLDDPNSKTILVKMPSSPTSLGRGQPSNFPTPAAPKPKNLTPFFDPFRRPANLVDQNLGAGGGGGNGGGAAEFDDQCRIPQKEQLQKSDTLNQGLTSDSKKTKKKKKKPKLEDLADHNLSLEAKKKIRENPKLLELSINSDSDKIDQKSFEEAESIMQAQRETGLFKDARRPQQEKEERNIDFIVSGAFYDEVDIKTPKSFYDSRQGPKQPIPQDTLDYDAKKLGGKSILQKRGSSRCLHVLDLKHMQPHQKELYIANFLQGAREANPELAKHIIVQNN